ncbi:MAG: small conductance mechanosensitive channel [Gaiellaceae bacterium]|nr:small conductance mechanosensitive channel [Gaiellaceae bacterium]
MIGTSARLSNPAVMESWQRLLVIGIVLATAILSARLIDRRIMGGDRSPEALTRYRVLRRTVSVAIVTMGVLSALLVIPQVRAVAGGLLASSAILGLIIGFASQRTLGNFVAGLMIATTQPLRLGDWVEVAGVEGSVEEIGLMYTFIRTEDNARLVIPNEKLASDTILNSTIRSAAKYAEVTVQVPLSADLRSLVEALREEVPGERDEVFVSSLDGSPTLTLRAWTESEQAAEQLEHDLRLRVHGRLRELGIYA